MTANKFLILKGTNLGLILVLVGLAFTRFSYAESKLSFHKCSKKQMQMVLPYVAPAKMRILELSKDVRAKMRKSDPLQALLPIKGLYSDYSRWQRTQAILKCSYRKLNIMRYVCAKGLKHDAATLPIIGRHVALNEGYFTRNEKAKIALLIHEATHKCGTTDADYFNSKKKPRDVTIVPWDTIASTYSYWIKQGFCQPAKDC